MAAKPIGIVILAVLQLLSALLIIYSGYVALMAALLLGPLGILFVGLAAILLIFGIIGLILFYGLWSLKGWAWLWTLIINILSILLNLYPFNWIGLILPVIIVVYLLVPSTRAAFKK
ncbi:MAG: hypothetical protein C4K49_03800 [Candidatus Thorarchaeota archaeon]|nr:MAG: hypothetical protein C4K49_03800 [Candidatus Thorarchaeota archaeon]